MKFNVAGKTFQQQLQAVSKVINSKNTLSILDNFLLRVEGNTLFITGSDQENVMTASLEIFDSEGDGAVALPAKTLMEITKEIANQPIEIEINDATFQTEIRFLNGHFNFIGVDPTEYPAKTENDDEVTEIIIPASVVQSGIEKTIFAISTETIRPIMTGIYWDIHPNDITFVSSDTHKLVRYINSEAVPGVETSFILAAKPAGILRSIITKEDGDVIIRKTAAGATFTFGGYSLSVRFIKGNYPNYNRVIPQDNPYSITVDRLSLLGALRRVALFANKASSLVRMVFHDNEIRLNCQDLDFSTSAEELVTCDYSGRAMTIGFNAEFTMQVIGNLPGDSLVIEISDPGRPGVFRPAEQPENENITTIQMPLQVMED